MASPGDLLRRIETLLQKSRQFGGGFGEANAASCLAALATAIAQKTLIFGIEPWHPLRGDLSTRFGEMLLRLKRDNGEPMPPYPAIMAFYNNDCAADIDIILTLCAINQFLESDQQQISVNISGRSLRDPEFVKAVLPEIEALRLPGDKKIFFEIHESAPSEIMNRKVLDLCRKLGIGFAIDDVGLSMNDIFRLSEFDEMADFIKIDRKTVCAERIEGVENALDHVMTLIVATLPGAAIVAEGVQDVQHARELQRRYPAIQYVQGLYLPDRETFARQYQAL